MNADTETPTEESRMKAGETTIAIYNWDDGWAMIYNEYDGVSFATTIWDSETGLTTRRKAIEAAIARLSKELSK